MLELLAGRWTVGGDLLTASTGVAGDGIKDVGREGRLEVEEGGQRTAAASSLPPVPVLLLLPSAIGHAATLPVTSTVAVLQ